MVTACSVGCASSLLEHLTTVLCQVQVEPVVIQCYKTAACFATCWLALLLTDFTFTPWGIVGGLIWVRTRCHVPLTP